jgi:hypothetical protein
METINFVNIISSSPVIGTAGGAAMIILYKLWRLLQADRKEDALDEAERLFRDEMRTDIKSLRELLKECDHARADMQNKILKLQKMLGRIQAVVEVCKQTHPSGCPIDQISGVFDDANNS